MKVPKNVFCPICSKRLDLDIRNLTYIRVLEELPESSFFKMDEEKYSWRRKYGYVCPDCGIAVYAEV